MTSMVGLCELGVMAGNVGSAIGDSDGIVGSKLSDPLVSAVGEKVGFAELVTIGLFADGKELVVG